MKCKSQILQAVFLLIIFASPAFALPPQDLHLHVQTVDATGNIETGTFLFRFDITSDSACTNILYNRSDILTTDARGIISHYLENVSLSFNDTYYLCYYRDGILKSANKLAQSPYSFYASNVSWSNIQGMPAGFADGADADTDTFNTSAEILQVINESALNLSKSFAYPETDSAHDTCAEIAGCVVGAISDGNTGWDNTYSLITNETMNKTSTGLTCIDCLDTTQIQDIYVSKSGDTITGNLVINGNLTIIGARLNASVTDIYMNGSQMPSVTGLFDMGSATLYWNNVFATRIHATLFNGSMHCSNITGAAYNVCLNPDTDTWNTTAQMQAACNNTAMNASLYVNYSWNNLANMPAGFADGTDADTDTWNTTAEMITVVNSSTGYFSNMKNAWANLQGVPAGFADGVDDTGAGVGDGTGGWTNNTVNTTTSLRAVVANITINQGNLNITNAAAPGNLGLLWSGGSSLIEQLNGGGGIDRMIYLPNGNRLDVLNEIGTIYTTQMQTGSIKFFDGVANADANVVLAVIGTKVGVGTIAPGGKLAIWSGYSAAEKIWATAQGDALIMEEYYGDAPTNFTRTADIVANTGDTSPSQMRFWTKALNASVAERMRITQDGNVGINHPNATSKFQVNGTTNLTMLSVQNLVSCDTIDTFANGTFKCGTDETGVGAGDGNNYTESVSFNDTGSTFQLNVDRVGMLNLSALFTVSFPPETHTNATQNNTCNWNLDIINMPAGFSDGIDADTWNTTQEMRVAANSTALNASLYYNYSWTNLMNVPTGLWDGTDADTYPMSFVISNTSSKNLSMTLNNGTILWGTFTDIDTDTNTYPLSLAATNGSTHNISMTLNNGTSIWAVHDDTTGAGGAYPVSMASTNGSAHNISMTLSNGSSLWTLHDDTTGAGGFTYSDYFNQSLNTTNSPTFNNITSTGYYKNSNGVRLADEYYMETMKCDFQGGVLLGGYCDFSGAAVGAGTTAAIAGNQTHRGVNRISDSATAGGGWWVGLTELTSVVLQGGECSKFIFYDNADRAGAIIKMGFFDSYTVPTLHVDGCALFVNSSTNVIYPLCSNNSATTFGTSNYTLTNTKFYKAKICIQSQTNATFELYQMGNGGALWTHNITTNIPTLSTPGRATSFAFFAGEGTTDAAAIVAAYDYIEYSNPNRMDR